MVVEFLTSPPCCWWNHLFLVEPRCVQLYMLGALLLLFVNSGDDRYISRAMREKRPRNKKRAVTEGQPATPLRPPLKECNEEQPEGNRADKKKKALLNLKKGMYC